MISFLRKQQFKFKDWVQCPSNYSKETVEDTMFNRKTRVFRAGSNVEGVFGDEGHTAWHTFEKTVGTQEFESTRSGKLFPHRSDFTKKYNGVEELNLW